MYVDIVKGLYFYSLHVIVVDIEILLATFCNSNKMKKKSTHHVFDIIINRLHLGITFYLNFLFKYYF